jgi:hypothetical protein
LVEFLLLYTHKAAANSLIKKSVDFFDEDGIL